MVAVKSSASSAIDVAITFVAAKCRLTAEIVVLSMIPCAGGECFPPDSEEESKVLNAAESLLRVEHKPSPWRRASKVALGGESWWLPWRSVCTYGEV